MIVDGFCFVLFVFWFLFTSVVTRTCLLEDGIQK